MIQRIQSLYLFLAAVCSGVLLAAPLYNSTVEDKSYTVYLGGLIQGEEVIQSQPSLVAVGIILMIFPLIILFLFKKRALQLRLTASLMLANTAMLLLLIATINKTLEKISGTVSEGTYGWGLALPLIGVLFIFLANRAIRKDEALVRSADRLR
jgi:hypothetical protein